MNILDTDTTILVILLRQLTVLLPDSLPTLPRPHSTDLQPLPASISLKLTVLSTYISSEHPSSYQAIRTLWRPCWYNNTLAAERIPNYG